MKDGFKTGSGCFECEICKKLTRKVKGQSSGEICNKCEEEAMHENGHADNDFPNDDCGEADCHVKNIPIEKRWWGGE